MRCILHTGVCFVVLAFAAVTPKYSVGAASATRVGCPNLSVSALNRSVSFYTGVLDFRLVSNEDTSSTFRLVPDAEPTLHAQTAHLALGSECLDLTQYESPIGRAYPADSRGNDRWFQHIAIVVSDMDKAYARVRDAHVGFVSSVPQTLPVWNQQAAYIAAFYFCDPDGHYLELIHFPPDKGQAKWQVDSTKLFLGIDHTAIVVSDTRASIHFYRDELHFRVTGGSENYGLEQEHLSGVFKAHVRITGLRSSSGIGIELLEYVTPSSGRPIPEDMHVEDIACWQTPIEISESGDPASSNDSLHDLRWKKLPPGHGEAAWVKDPDGHRLELLKQ